jgi:protein transport protein SEC23
LNSSSLDGNVILLMDSYFHIFIYYGKLICDWMKASYQDQEEFENFRELLEAPKAEATVPRFLLIDALIKREMLVDRLPIPRYIITQYCGSQPIFCYQNPVLPSYVPCQGRSDPDVYIKLINVDSD